MQSIEEIFLRALAQSGVCANLNDDVHIFTSNDFKDSKQWLVALDGFCEDIHFKRSWFSVYDATKKAFLVNLSDIVAKNAIPQYALCSLVIPRDFKPTDILEIVAASRDICREFGVCIVGGDTMLGSRLEFHICIFAKAKKPIKRAIKQRGLKIFCTQDRIYKIGDCYKQLMRLLRFKSDSLKQDLNMNTKISHKATHRFLSPTLRTTFMYRFSKNIQASMDISDGLLQDIAKMANGFGIKFSKQFLNMKKWQWQSGEEYEILFAIKPKDKKALKRILKICRIGAVEVGSIKRGKLKSHTKKWH